VAEEALGPNPDDQAVKADVQKYASAGQLNLIHDRSGLSQDLPSQPQGRVKSRSFEESHRERTTTANVLPHLGAIQALVTTRIPRAHSCFAIKLFCLKNVSVHKTL
jgi:hypothetical protein